jgi:magnesium chelatase subunit D
MEVGVSASRVTFPFTAIVGQETLKTALLLNAVDPRVGGVLIRGQKGTAKSTAVRALAAVLPPIEVVEGCRFSCDPRDADGLCDECRERAEHGELPVATRRPRVVDLPIAATEDRLVGSLDIEAALKRGERRFEAGLLATANRGILYVDEVNLLDDHLVDTLLDSAATGVNVVEREGVAFAHPARFILVGTMNPEEGDVRPQLLDRFGLCAEVAGLPNPGDRVEILERRRAYEDDPRGFLRLWDAEERALEAAIREAQTAVTRTSVERSLLLLIATVCMEAGVDGHRADLTMTRGAAAIAALEGRIGATSDDVRRVAPLVLAHRMRRRPFDEVSADQLTIDGLFASAGNDRDRGGEGQSVAGQAGAGEPETGVPAIRALTDTAESARGSDAGELAAQADRMRRHGPGARHESRTDDGRGRYSRAEEPRAGDTPDLAIDATIRAAAGRGRERDGGLAIDVRAEDVRNKVRTRRIGASIVFCVDASGSMGAADRMSAAKAAVLALLEDAYRRRDRVGLVTFHGDGAEALLAPTSSVELAQARLRRMPTGGATPLAAGIARSLELLEAERRRDTRVVPWLVLVTDGKANVGIDGGLGSQDARTQAQRVSDQRVHALVIDTSGSGSLGAAARELAAIAEAAYVRLAPTDGGALAGVVRERLEVG